MKNQMVVVLIGMLLLAACGGQTTQVPDHTAAVSTLNPAEHTAPTLPVHSSPIPPISFVSKGSPWLMFHHDEQHTGIADGVGKINSQTGPIVRWTYQVTAPPSEADFVKYRWYASFPLGDLDGDGTLEVVVTSADNSGETDRVIALKDVPGENPPVRALWTYTSPNPPGVWGFDQYSAALADADGDGLLDIFFSSKDGFVRALKGTTGEVIWEYDTNHFIEAGPMIADLDGDGNQEMIITTDCQPGPECVGAGATGGALFVFSANPAGGNPLQWMLEFPAKMDSAEVAIADLDAGDGQNIKALVFGAWDGKIHVVWRNPDGQLIQNEFDLRPLAGEVHNAALPNAVVRSSPLLYNFNDRWALIFGWMPDWTIGTEARISSIELKADMRAGTVSFNPLWTISRDDWKSSVALMRFTDRSPLVVTGYGIGTTNGTGNYGLCDPPMGGILAIDPLTGEIAWEDQFENEGNVRASAAVADVDGDGQPEAILSLGCYGKIYAYDGATGLREWGFQLGPRTIGTPSIGDLDGDGYLEIIVGSYDGQVYALGGQ
jgi:outer membrane protein assembly factor BamB